LHLQGRKTFLIKSFHIQQLTRLTNNELKEGWMYIRTPTEKCVPVMQQPNPIHISLLLWGKPQGNISIVLKRGNAG